MTELGSDPRQNSRRSSRDDLRLGAAMLLLSGALTAYGLYANSQSERTTTWPKTRGTIVASTYRFWAGTGEFDFRSYIPRVEYTYLVDGRTWRSGGVYRGEIQFASKRDVQDFLRRYPVGKPTDVYYSPADPSQSVLVPGETPETLGPRWVGYLAVGLLFAAGTLFVLSGLRGRRAGVCRSMPEEQP